VKRLTWQPAQSRGLLVEACDVKAAELSYTKPCGM
jgi:hypothetical protein